MPLIPHFHSSNHFGFFSCFLAYPHLSFFISIFHLLDLLCPHSFHLVLTSAYLSRSYSHLLVIHFVYLHLHLFVFTNSRHFYIVHCTPFYHLFIFLSTVACKYLIKTSILSHFLTRFCFHTLVDRFLIDISNESLNNPLVYLFNFDFLLIEFSSTILRHSNFPLFFLIIRFPFIITLFQY